MQRGKDVYAEGGMVEVEVSMVGGVESFYLLSPPFLVFYCFSGASSITLSSTLLAVRVWHWLSLSFHSFFFSFLFMLA